MPDYLMPNAKSISQGKIGGSENLNVDHKYQDKYHSHVCCLEMRKERRHFNLKGAKTSRGNDGKFEWFRWNSTILFGWLHSYVESHVDGCFVPYFEWLLSTNFDADNVLIQLGINIYLIRNILLTFNYGDFICLSYFQSFEVNSMKKTCKVAALIK